MTDALLDTIEAALKAATPGPWIRGKNTSVLVGDGGGIPQTETNAELIAHAPEWLQALVGRLRQSEQERDTLRGKYNYSLDQFAALYDEKTGAEAQVAALRVALQEIVANEECEIVVRGTDCLAANLVAPCPHCRAKLALGASAPPEPR